jgi:hypothetical protein
VQLSLEQPKPILATEYVHAYQCGRLTEEASIHTKSEDTSKLV